MKLLVDRLGASPTALTFEGDAAWWAEGAPASEWEPRPTGPMRFELEAYKMGEDVHLSGQASAELACACSRCLARYGHALREPFRIVLEPAAGRSRAWKAGRIGTGYFLRRRRASARSPIAEVKHAAGSGTALSPSSRTSSKLDCFPSETSRISSGLPAFGSEAPAV